jgi:hypothetical protein
MKKKQPLRVRIVRYAALISRRAREGHLPVPRQLGEMAALALLTGNGPGYYLTAGFYDRSVPFRDKRLHLGSKGYRARLATLNPMALRPFTQNKLVEKSVLTALGFPTPRFVGFLHPVTGRAADGRKLQNEAQFEAVIRDHCGRRLVFKILHGWAGQAFIAAQIHEVGGALRVSGLGTDDDSPPAEPEAFCRRLLAGQGSEGRLIEEYFDQHPRMAQFNPSSVNTCRIWVARARGGPARAVLGYLRIGRGNSLVDNQSAGGIVAPVDLESGVTRAAIDGLPERTSFARHPDHGAAIAGQSIPFWEEAKALAEDCVASFPGLRFAGTDVAVGPQGPVIIELNASPDREGAAFVGVPSGLAVPRN